MSVIPKQARLLVWLSTVLIAGFLAVSVLDFLVSSASIHDRISQQTLPLTADNVYSEIQKDLLRPVFISSLMAHDTFVRDWIIGGEHGTERIAKYLNEVKTKYDVVIASLATEGSRRYYYQGGLLRSMEGPDGPTDKWFYRVRKMTEPYETNVDPDEIEHNSMTVYVNYRVLDYQGNFIASTGVGLKLDTIRGLLDRYQEQFRRRIFFIDKAGKVVLTGEAMRHIDGMMRDIPGMSDVADRIMAGAGATDHLQYRRDGTLVLVNSRFIPELGWYLIVEQDDAEEIGAIRQVLMVNLAIGFAVSIVVLLIMRTAIRRYQFKIEALANEAMAQAAREKELAAEQQRFVAMVSHEFRTPLAIVDTALQSIRNKEAEVSPEVTARLQIVSRATRRIQELVENYLTKDRLDAVHRPRMIGLVDIFVLVARVVRRAENENIVMEFSGTPPHVVGDEDMLRIALSNLVGNAIKFSAADGVIRIAGTLADGGVKICIADNGMGISSADMPHIFERYYRGSQNRAVGSGLGLYLVKRIVEEHGGSVEADSELDKGTTICLWLPIADPAAPSCEPAAYL